MADGKLTNDPPVDDLTPESAAQLYECYIAHRTYLRQGEMSSTNACNRTFVLISTGAIALSLAFVQHVVDNPNRSTHGLYTWKLGLVLLGVSVGLILISLFLTELAFRQELKYWDHCCPR